MNIGIDIDGVILDSERLLAFYGEYFARFELNKKRVRNDSVSAEVNYNFTNEETSAFYDKYFDLVTKTCAIMPGAKEILQKLSAAGHNLYILTARGYYNKREIKYCRPRLKELGVKFCKIERGLMDKSAACEKYNLDVMIEDNPEHIKKILKTHTKVIQFKDELSCIPVVKNPMVYVANNWIGVYDILNKLS